MDKLTFYFDVCFGKRFPETLLRARPPFAVEYHGNKNNRFKQDTPDDKWLSEVGAKGWIVFSHDRKFHDDTIAAAAIRQHSIGCFYLCGASATTWDKLISFVRGYHSIVDLAKTTERPYIYSLTETIRFVKVRLLE